MRIRHPPGRSGRLWLIDRLAVAERAASILHRKHQALRQEEIRLAALTERSAARWTAAVRDAEAWQRQAMILGARSDLQAAATLVSPAGARLVWRTEMGVEIPAEASCDLPPTPPVPGTPTLAAAADAYRRALEAAVEHAAVTNAAARVSAELVVTQQRLRAVRDRWIPQLQAAVQALELRLDDHEREELSRSRSHHRTTAPSVPSTQEQP
jgi:V/A-type H+-transporting ATPase subunit D